MQDFLCPGCENHIRVGEQIIFKVKNNKKQSALLLLSPQIGNYSSVKHPSFEIQPGEYLEFFCPLCNTSLVSDIHQSVNTAHLRQTVNQSASQVKMQADILISR